MTDNSTQKQKLRIRSLLQSIPVSSSEEVPVGLINYVARTSETLVLNDATTSTTFAADPYIIKEQPKSVLCMPIRNQGKLIGIVYLENNLTTGAFTSDRIEVLRLLTSQAAISLENAKLYSNLEKAKEQLEDYSHSLENKVRERTQELKSKNEVLEETLNQLKTAQKQIVSQEKLASLGSLTAGIAHELKNPLNFVNNFADITIDLIRELLAKLDRQSKYLSREDYEEIEEVLANLEESAVAINEQGQKADRIIRGMLMHARSESASKEPTDINSLLDESVQLVYHGMRAKYDNFNIQIETDYDESVGQVDVLPQEMSRVFLNIINNACYETHTKKQKRGSEFIPQVSVMTRSMGDRVEIRIRDNGNGIPSSILDKIFNPFFTTKPTGEGTGLGLSISHDLIVGQHRGEIQVETEPGTHTEFIIRLPNNKVLN